LFTKKASAGEGRGDRKGNRGGKGRSKESRSTTSRSVNNGVKEGGGGGGREEKKKILGVRMDERWSN